MNTLKFDERVCPKCGEIARADFVDIGVGNAQCGPFSCEACGWIEDQPEEEFDLPGGCTCSYLMSPVNIATIDPSEPIMHRDPWCPVHGKDPDDERDRAREDTREFPNASDNFDF